MEEEEAKLRLQRFGYNELEREKRPSSIGIFLRQFKNVLVIVLFAAALISLAVSETVEPVVILGIIVAVSLLGFFQEYRAERALEALRKMAALTATVIRGSSEKEIPARELVPGDIAVLSVGDKIPTDLRLIEAVNLRVDESALTGESVQKLTLSHRYGREQDQQASSRPRTFLYAVDLLHSKVTQLDAITAINFVMCVVILILGVMAYGKKKVAMPLLVGIAFGLFAVSHVATLLGFAEAWGSFLIVVRTIAYLLVIYALFRLALASYTKT